MRQTAERLLENARIRGAEFDAIDARHGNATPLQAGLLHVIGTMHAACNTALLMHERGDDKQSLSCVADAVVLGEQAIKRFGRKGR